MYTPPYAREIDDLFVRNLVKYLAPVSSLRVGRRSGESRMHVVASSGNETEDGVRSASRTTVVVEMPGPPPGADTRRIGFVYPGAVNEEASSADSSISGDGAVSGGNAPVDAGELAEEPDGFEVDVELDVLYRLRPTDIIHRLADVLYLVAQWEPALFSDRGRTNLERLASPEARAATVRATDRDVMLTYSDDAAACCLSLQASSAAPDRVIVRRRPAQPPAAVSARPYARSA